MKKLIAAAIVILFLVLIIAIAIPFFIDLNRYKGFFESKIEEAIQRDVKIGRIKLSLIKGVAVNLEKYNKKMFLHIRFNCYFNFI